MEIAVMGATGNVGGELVELLSSAGHGVRALSRKALPAGQLPEGVRSFAVDLNDGTTLRDAVDGAQAAFMLSGYDDTGLIQTLQRQGVTRVALLSSSSAGSDASPDNAVAAYHLASERALSESTLEWTFLRPNTFMSNALRWAEAIRDDQPVLAPFADVAIATNDPRDVARVAGQALTADGHAGRIHRITGPEALLPAERVAILGSVLNRDLRFEAQADDDARAEMESSMPKPYVDAFFEFFVEGRVDETTVLGTVEQVTGTAPRSFRAWANEHASAF